MRKMGYMSLDVVDFNTDSDDDDDDDNSYNDSEGIQTIILTKKNDDYENDVKNCRVLYILDQTKALTVIILP